MAPRHVADLALECLKNSEGCLPEPDTLNTVSDAGSLDSDVNQVLELDAVFQDKFWTKSKPSAVLRTWTRSTRCHEESRGQKAEAYAAAHPNLTITQGKNISAFDIFKHILTFSKHLSTSLTLFLDVWGNAVILCHTVFWMQQCIFLCQAATCSMKRDAAATWLELKESCGRWRRQMCHGDRDKG